MAASAAHAAGQRTPPSARKRVGSAGRSSALLWTLVLFLVLEYARPPAIVQLKLQMLISIVLPVLCLMMIKDKRWSWSLTCQLGVIAVAATGVIYADNYYASYFTTRILYTTVVISISMAWLLSRIEFFRKGMWAWTLIMAYIGLFGLATGGFGPGGIIGDENELALACNTAVAMAYFGAISSQGFRRWIYAGIGLVLISAVVISNSRGGFVGLALIVAYIIVISKHRIRALIGLSIATVVFFLVAPRAYVNEVLSIGQEASGEIEDGTGDARLFLWTAAFNMWKAHPILGVGAGNSRFHTGQYQPDWEGEIYSDRDWSGTAIHSGLFEVLSELGSAGVFFYGAMIVNTFTILRRVRRTARTARGLPASMRSELEMYSGALSGALVGYLGSGVFLSVGYHPYAFYFAGLALALSWSLDVELQAISERAVLRSPTRPSTAQDSGPRATNDPPPSSSLGRELLSRQY